MIVRKKRSFIWKISKEDLEEIVKKSETFSAILRDVGLYPHGNNQKTLMLRLSQDNIDFSHIERGINSHKGKRPLTSTQPSLDSVLIENSNYNRGSLKKRLIKCNLLENKCKECGIGPEWNKKILSLQLDHINGVPNDNRIENLRILCPNCHSQTNNFAGKKRKKNIQE